MEKKKFGAEDKNIQKKEDALDYRAAAETKKKNRNWTSHSDLKKQLGME